MQVIGICRFSYPALGGFQVEHTTTDQRIEYLYKDEILGFRLKTFEYLTLPSIKNQSDQDFTFIVLIGDSLPIYAKEHLQALCKDVAPVKIIELPPLPHREAALAAFEQVRDPDQISVQFRLDDDDAVSEYFVSSLKDVAEASDYMLRVSNKVGIDFNSGYAVRFGPQGLEACDIRRPYLTPALGVMMRPGLNKTVLHFPHQRFAELMPTVTFPDPPMYLRCFHEWNDSTQTRPSPKFAYQELSSETEELFLDVFGVDNVAIKAWQNAL